MVHVHSVDVSAYAESVHPKEKILCVQETCILQTKIIFDEVLLKCNAFPLYSVHSKSRKPIA